MIAGHLCRKAGYWYMVLETKDVDGKRKPKWMATRLPVKGNKKQAEDMLYQKRVEYSALQRFSKNTGAMLFSDYLTGWLQSRRNEVAKATFNSYSFILNNQVIPYYEAQKIYLFELRPSDIAAYHQSLLRKSVSPNTVIRHHAVIHKALEDAVYRELIPSNPAARVRRPKKKEYIANPYTVDECRQLLEKIQGEQLDLAITLAIYSGMRRGELLGLRWGAIDFSENVIHINHSLVYGVVEKKHVAIGQDKLKRDASFRTLPMVELIRNKLCEEAERRYGSLTPPAQDYILVDKFGKVLKPNSFSDAFKNLLKRHGLRHIRLHDLRHSCANLLITARVPLIEVQQWLGHSSITTTADMYSHLTFDTKLNSAETIKNFEEA